MASATKLPSIENYFNSTVLYSVQYCTGTVYEYTAVKFILIQVTPRGNYKKRVKMNGAQISHMAFVFCIKDSI